jgi:hypothetical protein
MLKKYKTPAYSNVSDTNHKCTGRQIPEYKPLLYKTVEGHNQAITHIYRDNNIDMSKFISCSPL